MQKKRLTTISGNIANLVKTEKWMPVAGHAPPRLNANPGRRRGRACTGSPPNWVKLLTLQLCSLIFSFQRAAPGCDPGMPISRSDGLPGGALQRKRGANAEGNESARRRPPRLGRGVCGAGAGRRAPLRRGRPPRRPPGYSAAQEGMVGGGLSTPPPLLEKIPSAPKVPKENLT